MSATAPRERTSMARLVGLDLFRAVAVFGMLVAHVGPAAWTPGEGFGTVHVEWEFFHSRMPAMFAFAAGLSLNLGRRSAADTVQPAIVPTLIRAALIAVCGVALTLLGTPVRVILLSFAVWFVLVLPFRRLGVRALLVVAGVWTVAGPLLSFVARRAIDLPDDPVWLVLVGGDYPALTWMPFVLAGLAVGRMDLSSRRVRVNLATAGGVLISVGYGLSVLLLTGGVAARIMEGLAPVEGNDALQQFARLFFKERGVTDTGSWLWLIAPAPHSGSWADVIGCLGVCALLLAVLLPRGAERVHTRRVHDSALALRLAVVASVPAWSTRVVPRVGEHSHRTNGKASVCRMVAPVAAMTIRSTPRPSPPVGGIPNSSAARKSSSSCMASGSPPAALTDCMVRRRRCSIGSTSSE